MSFRLITWNIDFLVPHASERMAAALVYLKTLHARARSDGLPLVIMLQEMIESDLQQIQSASWIRDSFLITDHSTEYWESPMYGTTTLIEKRALDRRSSQERGKKEDQGAQDVFRVHYGNTRMQRDALFVDVPVSVPGGGNGVVRFCNTHLESLHSVVPKRPVQLRLASMYMHGTNAQESSLATPYGAVLAGDLNAFAPEDGTAVTEAKLKDAFLALGGKDGSEEGFTWGQQVSEQLRNRYGCSRMDKVLYCGHVKAVKLERIGEGVMASIHRGGEDENEDEVWVTDHLGLMVDFLVE